ncbi:phytoene desaturase family protein [Saccharothrix coeruleofusca]|uniref:Pyridine nucleotide-disulfide oxidoreductase domain-containing protein 2 n=1 Tax=Saccharothrix coeruleofusca TaxID=33919 RepID=A0A918AR12_9PSEU|nr:NAD(P)/FAD-dependent oxidoreductase [Saccharothrix coeruleofusca]MBP2335230.1 phytoene dehydrogenase-like protein [Saccharothrix coeruleofusca]GGP71691.1 FAD-dependent oxidoreductase [Saccharothrix coeruleofusca]
MSETVDAVVVGAGPNGLVAANLLADAGWDVAVLEAADRPGGAVRTEELTAPGFRNDVFSAFYPLGAGSPVLAGLDLERHGLRWRHAPEVLAHVLPDDRAVLLSRDVDRTAASLDSFGAGDGEVWQEEFALWQRIRDDLLDALLRPFPPVRAGARLLRALGAADALRFARTFVQSVRAYGDDRFAGEGARVLLAGNAMHTDLGPDQAGGTAFGWLLTMLGQDVGYPVPEGGAGVLAEALVRRLGGVVQCGRPVARIVVAGGRALGVRDAAGGFVRARKAVLADVPAPSLYLDMVGEEHLPARFRSDLAKFEWDDATIKVDWALSKPIPWTAPEARGAGTVHVGGDLNGLAAFNTEIACGRLPRTPFLIMGQMTTADPTRSPEGTESAWAYTHVPRGETWTADRLRRRADRMEQVIEQHAPGFRASILARAVHGPQELQERNRALVAGSTNSGTAGIHQQLVFRPVPGLGRPDTPVDRLYLAGASAHPGGGVHGAPGANAARAALARNGLAGEAYRLTVQSLHRALYR